jgi:hypothetical protein
MLPEKNTRSGLDSYYLVAAYGMAQTILEMRAEVQNQWRDVVHDGHNSAVAAAFSKLATNKIKRIESQIFVDFLGRESFKAVFDAHTHGEPESRRETLSFTVLKYWWWAP